MARAGSGNAALTIVIQSALPKFPLHRLRSIVDRYSRQTQRLVLDVGDRDLGEPGYRRASGSEYLSEVLEGFSRAAYMVGLEGEKRNCGESAG